MSLALVIVLNALFAAVAIGGVLIIALRAVHNENRNPRRAVSGVPEPLSAAPARPGAAPYCAPPRRLSPGARQSASGTLTLRLSR